MATGHPGTPRDEPRLCGPREQDGPDRLGTAGEGRARSPGPLHNGHRNRERRTLTAGEGTRASAVVAIADRTVPHLSDDGLGH
jgi:hypothetical protein